MFYFYLQYTNSLVKRSPAVGGWWAGKVTQARLSVLGMRLLKRLPFLPTI